MSSTDFGHELNEEQRAAATAPDGPVLVLAAAGTGKTRTLVYRVAYLVENGVPPSRILLLTFTNKAAHEMLERAEMLVHSGVGGIWGGTFHHFANRILRRHGSLLGYPTNYPILDREDSKRLVAKCIKDRNLKAKDFPKADVLLGLASMAANKDTDVEVLVEDRFEGFDVDQDAVLKVIDAYAARKKSLGSMDFDDLLVNAGRLLRDHAEVRDRYREQFLHVLVDEYQDTNPIQAEMVDSVAEGHGNVFVVGDDFQSIYAWRGADFRNIMSFPERYPGTKQYLLETNYRSVPEILDVANACIAGNPEQFQKTLRATREGHCRPRVVRVRDGQAQGRLVVDEVRRLRRDGYKPSDIAILYRAHFHAMELQMILNHEGMPFLITSGMRFFEQAHIKDVCSLLRLVAFPGDEMAFSRVMELVPGIGPVSSDKAWKRLGGRFDPSNVASRQALVDALTPRARAGWARVDQALQECEAKQQFDNAGEMVMRFMENFYHQHLVETYDNADRRTDDISELVLYTAKFDSLRDFLADVALATNLDTDVDSLNADDSECLRLSTVHQAKGLEWPVVIVLWLVEGMFPSGRSIAESAHAESEERRLFYVTATRAKDELIMCTPSVRRGYDGTVTYCRESRFVGELPRELFKEYRPALI